MTEIIKYKLNENIKADLSKFIETTKKCKSNPYCRLEEFEKINLYFPNFEEMLIEDRLSTSKERMDEKLNYTQHLDSNRKSIIEGFGKESTVSLSDDNQDYIKDNADRIQECLITSSGLSGPILNDLHCIDAEKLREIFLCLSTSLTMENIRKLYTSLIETSDKIVESYIHCLIISNMKMKFIYEVENILFLITEKHQNLLIAEIGREILNSHNEESNKILLQYVMNLDSNFQQCLLSHVTNNISKLHENHILVVDALLKFPICSTILNKIIKLMFNAATKFSNTVSYGKLLFKIIQNMEPFGTQFEQPLNYILNTHQSIWKIKARRDFIKYCADETFLESQI